MVEVKEKVDVEKMLKGYTKIVANIRMIKQYPIGMGMSVTPTSDDDLLQDLHKSLKGLPSYLYLKQHEAEIERVANMYMYEHPYGIKAQLRQVQDISTLDQDDEYRLEQLERKLKKVIKTRRGGLEDKEYNKVLDRICELQVLEEEKLLIDTTLDALAAYKKKYEELITLRYCEDKTIDQTIKIMDISSRTFDRWKSKALKEFERLLLMS